MCEWENRWNKIGSEFIIVRVGAGDIVAHYIIHPAYYMFKNFQNKYACEKVQEKSNYKCN